MIMGKIEVISIFAIFLAVLLSFSMLKLVSAEQPSGHACYDESGFNVYIKALPGCNNIDCSICETRTGSPCTGTPAPTYYDCGYSQWDCNRLDTNNIDPDTDYQCKTSGEYVEVYMGKSSMTTLVPVENIKGYYVTYPDACIQGARFFERWDTDFKKCVEIVDGEEIYHGFLIGTECSSDTDIVSVSSTEFGQTAVKTQRCSGWCPPPHVFTCSPPGIPVTILGCQEDGEACYKGWNDVNKNGASEETAGYCDDGECKNLNFWIESVAPIQVLEGFDWIENKPGMIRVKANFDNKFKPVEEFPDEKEDVKIKLILWKLDENGPYFPITWTKIWEKPPKTEDIKRVYSDEDIKKGKNTINFFDIKISEPGSYRFEAIIDPDNNTIESKEIDNTKSSMLFRVREVDMPWSTSDKLRIVYVPIAIGRWKVEVNPEEYRKTVLKSQEFIRATYPLDPEKIGMYDAPVQVPSNLMSDPPSDPVMREIYFNAMLWRLSWWAWGEWLLTGETTRFVGVVPAGTLEGSGQSTQDWYHKIIFLGAGGVLIESGTESVAAHEIGHTFGLGEPEEYNSNPRFGNVVQQDGWWVIKGAEGARINLDKDRSANDLDEHLYDIINGLRMELDDRYPRYFCFMGDSLGVWVDREDYQKLIDKFIGE